MVKAFLGRAAVAACLSLAACDEPVGHDEVLVGPYRLVAIGSDDDMGLCWTPPDGGECVGDGVPGPTLYAAGFDNKFVVAAIHPKEYSGPTDRSVSQYFYIIRSADEAKKLPYSAIEGPFDEAHYAAEKARLKLPEFTRLFLNLR